MLNFKDIFIEDIEQEVETSSSLPFIIPVTQTVYGDLKTNNGIGTIGNNNFCFSFEFPVDDADAPNIKKYRDVINEFVLLKFSKTELFNDFWIYKIPDYSSQALTPGFLDFIPFVMVGNYTNGYTKILQNHIAILRSYYTKQAYILIDKKAKIGDTTVYSDADYSKKKIAVLLKFKRYYDYKKNINDTINYQLENNETNTNLKYNETKDIFEGDLKIKTSAFTESDLKRISFSCNNNKLYNNHIIQNLKLFLVKKDGNNDELISLDEYDNKVERQSAEKRDYYHILMNMLYNKDSINKIAQQQEYIIIRIEINNYLFDTADDAKQANVNVYLEQDTPPIKTIKDPRNININVIKNYYPNITSSDQFLINEYGEDENGEIYSELNCFYDLNNFSIKTLNKYIEIIPLNYEDRIFIFPIESDGTLNVHTALESGNIYKPYLDLSSATIYRIKSNKSYYPAEPKKNSLARIDKGCIPNLKENDIVVITIDKNIRNIEKDNRSTSATISSFNNYTALKNDIEKYTIKEDPYLETYYTSDISVFPENISSKLANNGEVFAYDTITFDGLDDVLTDGEIRVKKVDFKDESTGKILTSKYALTGQTYQYGETESGELTPDGTFLSIYSDKVKDVKDQINDLYTESIEKVYNAHTFAISNYLSDIKQTFAHIYNNITPKELSGNSKITNSNGFLFLALELNNDQNFDLIVKDTSGNIYYKEYNCHEDIKTIGQKYIYIHLPFYLFESQNSVLIPKDEIPELIFEIVSEDNSNSIKNYYFQK